MTAAPWRVSREATQPIRSMFVSRSSFENPSPFERWVRTVSPSRYSTMQPRASSSGPTRCAIVVLPAPERLQQRLDLPDVAAAVGVPLPQVRPLRTMLLRDRRDLRPDQRQPVALDEEVAGLVGLAEEEMRVELDHVDVETELGDHVHEH